MDRATVEQAEAPMPTQEVLRQAAATIKPLLPPDFYGRVILIFEAGNALRVEVNQSFKL